MKASIKNRIQMLRDVQGIDQQKLADDLGITRSYLSKLEHLKFSPGPELMEKICIYFGKDLGEVFYIGKLKGVIVDCRKQNG